MKINHCRLLPSVALVASVAWFQPAQAAENGNPNIPRDQPASGTAPADATVHTGVTDFGKETDPSSIDMPPPTRSPQAEVKTASPGPRYLWVPGYYKPVKGQWTWVPGVWGMPPTPESVWIESTYDPTSKRWSEGHWQPDGKPAVPAKTNDSGKK